VIESTTLEIALPDLKGVVKKLSAQKGKVVVLCFTAYQTEFSPSLNMILGEIYASDRAKGVEIYQVSLDDDENFWKVSASHLPWICVRDPNGSRTIVAKTFNISQLPTIFLVDRNGDISSKNQNLKSLSAEIAKLL
jgi:peroxiredoxin